MKETRIGIPKTVASVLFSGIIGRGMHMLRPIQPMYPSSDITRSFYGPGLALDCSCIAGDTQIGHGLKVLMCACALSKEELNPKGRFVPSNAKGH
jgi:hypothetical protein